MDWALGVFVVVAGTTVASLRWWCSHEVIKVERGADSPGLTTSVTPSTPRDNKRDAL